MVYRTHQKFVDCLPRRRSVFCRDQLLENILEDTVLALTCPIAIRHHMTVQLAVIVPECIRGVHVTKEACGYRRKRAPNDQEVVGARGAHACGGALANLLPTSPEPSRYIHHGPVSPAFCVTAADIRSDTNTSSA